MLSIPSKLFASYILWIPHILYLCLLIPQINLNYKLRSARGLSDLKLLGYFGGYMFQLFYIYGLNLPLANKVAEPIGLILLTIILYQRFSYHRVSKKSLLYRGILSIIFASILLLIFFPTFTKTIGLLGGWIASVIWGLYSVPQILKIQRKRSTHGFSFAFVNIFGIGVALELFAALVLRLPLPTIVNTVRGLCIYAIYLFQFATFPRTQPRRRKKRKIGKVFPQPSESS